VASISPDARGYQRIFFVSKKDGKAKCIRWNDSREALEDIAKRVELLNAATGAGQAVSLELCQWLDRIGAPLHRKLAAAGLVAPRAAAVGNLGDFLNRFIADRKDKKFRTRLNREQARDRLLEHFGANRDIGTITPGDADEWLVFMKTRPTRGKEGYAPATISRTIKHVKGFFKYAVRKRVLAENPFADFRAGSMKNRTRDFFVTQDVIQRVIEACPDAEWRLIVALSRFGGLTCPSEHLNLKWSGVDWERSRFRVHKAKNEAHEDGGDRLVPIFPELRPYLEEAFELAGDGAVYVIGRYRDTSANLRTQLLRIVERAGVFKWPKLFQNLRASRVTEARRQYPAHVCNAWFGHTEQVAQDHYLQVCEDDFERAATKGVSNRVSKSSRRTQGQGTERQANPQEKRGLVAGNAHTEEREYARRDLNPQPMVPKTIALSS
jgi:integrase